MPAPTMPDEAVHRLTTQDKRTQPIEAH